MASFGNQPTWVPYEPSKDCSQGFCSIYCPQWCYIVFPPPPPFELSEEESGPTFSPLVIAIIGILASAFLLVTYYTIMSKYCSSFDSLRRWILGPGTSDREPDFNLGQSHQQETWQVSPSNGIEEALINKIAVCKYRKGDGLVDGTDCSVCLSEFRDGESLRLLPKCSHAFHVQCIDAWLKSHSTCPLCRANILSANTPPPLQLPLPPPEQDNSSTVGGEMIVVVEDLESGVEEETHLVNDGDEQKSERIEEANAITEIRDGGVQPIRRSFSVDSQIFRLSIADVLQISMEDELLAAKEHGHGLLGGVGGSERRWPGEHSKDSGRSRALHCVMSPVPMKRSFSSGRLCFSGYGRGRNPLLPM